MPDDYMRILDTEVKTFLDLCLLPEAQRPSAETLLKHEFFNPGPNDNHPVGLRPDPGDIHYEHEPPHPPPNECL